MKLNSESTLKNSTVLWQNSEENGVGEPALLIESYNGCIIITQDGNHINLNYESVQEFCKILKQCKEPG